MNAQLHKLHAINAECCNAKHLIRRLKKGKHSQCRTHKEAEAYRIPCPNPRCHRLSMSQRNLDQVGRMNPRYPPIQNNFAVLFTLESYNQALHVVSKLFSLMRIRPAPSYIAHVGTSLGM